jgi:hypothetical protein
MTKRPHRAAVFFCQNMCITPTDVPRWRVCFVEGISAPS